MKSPAPTRPDPTADGEPNSGRVPTPAKQAAPADLLYFEDFPEGERQTFARHNVTAEEIIGFASEFDPQPFHLDEAAAAETLLGGLAASGWHSCALLMRMICDGFLCRTKGLGGPGIEECRWRRPVRPGDNLTARYTITEKRVTRSRPGVGLCRFFFELENQHGEVVMTWNCPIFIALRDGPEAK